MQSALTTLDVAVLVAYLAGVAIIGTLAGGRQRDVRDYFLAGRSVPWWAICFSVVATETSALTFISVPATAYTGDLWFLQIACGYIIGRIIVAWLLLPRYFSGELVTAYQLLEQRFGVAARRFGSVVFMVTRAFADSVRIFAAAVPVSLISGLPYWQSILLAGAVTTAYTYTGGLRAVIWIDVVQMGLYIFGGVVSVYVLGQLVPGGWPAILDTARTADRLQVVHMSGGLASSQWVLTGVLGGAALSMASHGADHLIVQRLLAADSLTHARRALIGSGVFVFAQFALFLFVGIGLYSYFGARTFAVADEVFPRFIIEGMPRGIAGLIVAGILAAMMSTVSSSLNSLASAATHDIYAPLCGRPDHVQVMRAARMFTLFWAIILIGGALLFQLVQQGTPVVVLALEISSFTYGGLLGGFMLAIVSRRADQRDVMTGMVVGILAMTVLWAVQQFSGVGRVVAGLWFALIGSTITLAVGILSAQLRSAGGDGD